MLRSPQRERPKATVNKQLGPYQCGFRPGKSTSENMIDTHNLEQPWTARKELPLRHYV